MIFSMQNLFMQIYIVKYKVVLISLIALLSGSVLTAQVPDWARGVVWYQIFPDRFCNGDTTNDPTLEDIAGCWPHNDTAAWAIMPWTSDWYALQPWEQANGQDFNYNVQRRRYGGDLQGIINKLDYLDSLGIGAIYLNPVFWAPSLHKYDAAMYHHIDPNFGPDPDGDKKIIAAENPVDPSTWQWTSADRLALTLIAECHARGMRIIFDGVFNHMGVNSFAFQDIVKNQAASPYADWFNIESFADTATGSEFKYAGWFNAPDLPEFKEDSNGIVAGPRKYIFDCTRRWMAPNGNVKDGIDGWRLDVAFCVDMDFWDAWSREVRLINPEAYLTAEINNKIEEVLPYVEQHTFDAVMHYTFASLCVDYFVEQRINSYDFALEMMHLMEVYPGNTLEGMMNLYDSHDTPRLLSVIHNPHLPAFQTWGDFLNASHAWYPGFKSDKPTAADYAMQKRMAVFQFVFPGSPMIYYGDEVGMWGANDPDCRKPMLWADKQYAPEQYNVDQSLRMQADSVAVNTDMLQFYRKLATLREQHPVLTYSNCTIFPTRKHSDMVEMVKMSEDETIEISINNGTRARKIRIKSEQDFVYTELLSGKEFSSKNGKLKITIPAGEAYILITRSEIY